MSSPCLSGSRTYRLDLEIVKSPSSSTRTSQTSSPSSTLSESSNSPLAISTRKPRTPRKRPNQTYNEAAALLSTAYPNIFSTKHLTNPSKFSKPHESALLLDESSELLLPFRVFDNSGFLLHQPLRDVPAGFFNEPKVSSLMSPSDKSCQSSSSTSTTATTWEVDSLEVCDGYREEVDFDAESILDEEIEEGIDSIMGNLSVSNEISYEPKNSSTNGGGRVVNPGFGNQVGFNLGGRFQFGFGMGGGMRKGVRALRRVPDGNWPNFPIVDMLQISPRLNANMSSNSNYCNSKPKLELSLPKWYSGDKKKKKKVEKPMTEVKSSDSELIKGNSVTEVANSRRLRLKLNYDEVLEAWSDRGLPFPEEILGAQGQGNDVSRLPLLTENF